MPNVLRHRAFVLLFAGNLAATFAGWTLGLALSVHVFALTGSATAAGGLLIAGTLPAALFGTVAGVLGDRWDRRRSLRWISALRVLVVAALWTAGGPGSLWILYAVVVVQATAQQVFIPAEQALIAAVVPANDLLAANSANSAGTNATRIAAPAVGGLLVGVLGFNTTVAVIVACLGLAAVLIGLLPADAGSRADREPTPVLDPAHAPTPLQDWKDGLCELRKSRPARAVVVLQSLDAVKEGALTTVYPVLMLGLILASPTEMGLVNSSFAVAAVIAAPFLPAVIRRLGYTRPIGIGAGVSGLTLGLLVVKPTVEVAFLSFLLAGAPFTISWVASNTLLLTSVPIDQRARAVGTTGNVCALAMLASAAVSGVLADAIGVLPVLAAAAAVQTLAGGLFIRMVSGNRS